MDRTTAVRVNIHQFRAETENRPRRNSLRGVRASFDVESIYGDDMGLDNIIAPVVLLDAAVRSWY